ncbi:MAG: hypothetical protein Q9209_000317 [Squamulea sp. 1 TL-2023]
MANGLFLSSLGAATAMLLCGLEATIDQVLKPLQQAQNDKSFFLLFANSNINNTTKPSLNIRDKAKSFSGTMPSTSVMLSVIFILTLASSPLATTPPQKFNSTFDNLGAEALGPSVPITLPYDGLRFGGFSVRNYDNPSNVFRANSHPAAASSNELRRILSGLPVANITAEYQGSRVKSFRLTSTFVGCGIPAAGSFQALRLLRWRPPRSLVGFCSRASGRTDRRFGRPARMPGCRSVHTWRNVFSPRILLL